jgi:hypothetical protein
MLLEGLKMSDKLESLDLSTIVSEASNFDLVAEGSKY